MQFSTNACTWEFDGTFYSLTKMVGGPAFLLPSNIRRISCRRIRSAPVSFAFQICLPFSSFSARSRYRKPCSAAILRLSSKTSSKAMQPWEI